MKDGFLRRALIDLTRTETNCAEQMTIGLQVRFLQLLFRLYQDIESRRDDREHVFNLPVQRKDLAALLGATPESISRMINRLEELGLVHFDGLRVTFSNMGRCLATMRIGREVAATEA